MIDAIILAAGRSRRMGTQKLLLPFAGQTVIGHIADQVLAAPIRRLFIVVSDEAGPVAAPLAAKRVTLVVNPNPNAEMLSSVRLGLQALSPDTAAAMIVLGDQPSLRPELIRHFVETFPTTSKGIILPIHNGKRGHPLLIAARYFDEIQTQFNDAGLRGLLSAHTEDVEEVDVEDPGVLADMDHPEDYERELFRHGVEMRRRAE